MTNFTTITIKVPKYLEIIVGKTAPDGPYFSKRLETAKLPESSNLKGWTYGMMRLVNDKAGGKDRSPDNKKKVGQECFNRLINGWVDERGGGLSPIESGVRRLLVAAMLSNKVKESAKDALAFIKGLDNESALAKAFPKASVEVTLEGWRLRVTKEIAANKEAAKDVILK